MEPSAKSGSHQESRSVAPIRRAFHPAPGFRENHEVTAGFGFNFEPPVGIDAGGNPAATNVTGIFFSGPVSAPPPPPKPVASRAKPAASPIPVSQGVQMAKLVRKLIPVYPPLAKSARISGVVHLVGTIAKDGSIRDLRVLSGHPLLVRAAVDAVEQWVFRPTLLNGEPVEVIAPIDVSFTLGN